MRIAQLANFYHPCSGGLRTAVDHLGAGYVAAGHTRLLIIPGPLDRRHERPRDTTVEVAAPVLARSGGYRLIVRTREVHRILDAFQPDVIELSDQTTLVPVTRTAQANGCRRVLLVHERIDARFASRAARGLTRAARRRIVDAQLGRLLGASDAVVTCSRFAAEPFRHLGAELHVVPLGVDLDRFRPQLGRSEPGTLVRNGQWRRWLVYVGRLHAEKRPDLAIDTLRALHRLGHGEFGLIMIGEGPLRSRLSRRAKGLPVRFTGHLHDVALLSLTLGRCEVALAPGCVETFGLAALEALACGLAVVGANRGATGEVIGNAGALSEPEPDCFAEAVLGLSAIPNAERARRARVRAEQFGWPAATAGVLAVHGGATPAVVADRHEPFTRRRGAGPDAQLGL